MLAVVDHAATTFSGFSLYRQDSLRRLECFGVTAPAFHSSYPHQREKRLVVPPIARPLRGVRLVQQGDLAPPQLNRDRHVAIGSAEVAVPLRDLVVEYQSIAPHGWLVRNVSAVRNGWQGLGAANGMRILGGHYNANDQLGIGGNAATGVVLDGLDNDPATLDKPELARNHTLHASCTFEGGGMKWDVGQVTVRNAHVHDNDCRGLGGHQRPRRSHRTNLVEHNLREGIFYEISQDAVIRNNMVHRNGHAANGWYWAAGINVNASFDVEVYGNRMSGNYNGITGVQQSRPEFTPPAHLLDKLHDNLICATGAGGHPPVLWPTMAPTSPCARSASPATRSSHHRASLCHLGARGGLDGDGSVAASMSV
jgi:hypothetical protein